MSQHPIQGPTHPDELLPWFVNNTLSSHERKEVDDHVATCPRCQKEIAFLQMTREQVKTIPVQSPGEFGLNRLLKEIKRNREDEQRQRKPRNDWWRRGLAIVASLIIITQAGLLVDAWFFSKPMVPLSGPQDQGVVLQLSFKPTAMEVEIREIVNAAGGTFVEGPGELGVYRIRLNLSSADQEKIHQTIEYLRQRKNIVTHVARE